MVRRKRRKGKRGRKWRNRKWKEENWRESGQRSKWATKKQMGNETRPIAKVPFSHVEDSRR